MKWIVLFLTLATGCVSPTETPDFVSWNGVKYYFDADQKWDPAQINLQEDFLIRQLIENEIYPAKDVVSTLVQVRVFVTDGPLSVNGAPVMGYQDGFDLYVVNLGCPFNSAVAHEMGHLIQTSIDKWIDYRHLDFQFWRLVEESAGECAK